MQSNSELEREVNICAPAELGLPDGLFLNVVKHMYVIPESGPHWYLTYFAHHLDTLKMNRSKADPCVLIHRNNGSLEGLIHLQVDDSLGLVTS